MGVRVRLRGSLAGPALATVLMVGLGAGCTSAGTTSAAPSSVVPSPATSSPAASDPAGASTNPAPVGASTPAPRAGGGTSTPAVTTPGGDESQGSLPFGHRRLTGIVERHASCTMLLVGSRRWALSGSVAESLTVGRQVTVEGNLTPTPAACSGQQPAQAVEVTRATPA